MSHRAAPPHCAATHCRARLLCRSQCIVAPQRIIEPRRRLSRRRLPGRAVLHCRAATHYRARLLCRFAMHCRAATNYRAAPPIVAPPIARSRRIALLRRSIARSRRAMYRRAVAMRCRCSFALSPCDRRSGRLTPSRNLGRFIVGCPDIPPTVVGPRARRTACRGRRPKDDCRLPRRGRGYFICGETTSLVSRSKRLPKYPSHRPKGSCAAQKNPAPIFVLPDNA